MILEFFMLLPYRFLSFMIGILPAGHNLPPEILSGAVEVGGTIGIFSPVLPVATLGAALAILFGAQIGIWTWKTLKVLMTHLPWIGGHR